MSFLCLFVAIFPSAGMNTDLEIKLLKETIFALREELEKGRFEERDHIQAAVAAANDEIRHLRASVVELREQLEIREAQHDERVRNLGLQHEREKTEFHRTIKALRERLEEVNESLEKIRRSSEAAAGSAR
jgi:chromosome segregation ATPase